MADQQSGEKTEEATPKRVRESRKKGQVAKSKDMNTIVLLIVAFMTIVVFFDYMGEHCVAVFHQALHIISQPDIEIRDMFSHLRAAGGQLVMAVIPYLGILMFAALFISYVQVGSLFTVEPLKPQFKRLNAIENVKNMAKISTLVELVKNTAKITIVFLIAYFVLKANIDEVLKTMTATPLQGAGVAGSLLMSFMVRICLCFIVIAIIDLAFQRWNHAKQMRMTKDEVKREYKQDEGDPLIKSMRKQLHQELAMSDVQSAVGASDMMVTNPTHVAVAIKYDDTEMGAPQIMMKGQRQFAQLMREIAEEQGVPIMHNVPLAWALLELEIGDEVPESLYTAVAELLTVVYQMREES